MKVHVFVLTLIALSLVHAAAAIEQRSAEEDQRALVALENEWLASEHDAKVLDRILAPDFMHPVVSGDFLSKAEHIDYASKHLPPANRKQHFEQMKVRIFGDTAIVNGLVVTTDQNGHEIDKTIFTDVFVYRDGRWLAVNAQENKIQTRPTKP
jgi:hypothetical protein